MIRPEQLTFFWQLQSQAQQTPPAVNDSGGTIGWLLGVVLAGGVIYMVARPLTLRAASRQSSAHSQPQQRLATAATQARLEGLQDSANAEQQSLTDLDFDRELGIMAEQDYEQLKVRSNDQLDILNKEIARLQQRLISTSIYANSPAKPLTAVKAKDKKPDGNQQVSNGRNGDVDHLQPKPKLAVKDKLKCGECGTPFKPGDRFCSKCSAPLPLLCLNCGREISEDDRFCAGCGAAVNV